MESKTTTIRAIKQEVRLQEWSAQIKAQQASVMTVQQWCAQTQNLLLSLEESASAVSGVRTIHRAIDSTADQLSISKRANRKFPCRPMWIPKRCWLWCGNYAEGSDRRNASVSGDRLYRTAAIH